jgi:integrase
MGRGRKGSGIEIRDAAIRIGFQYQGKRKRETLDLEATPANIKYAHRLVDEIKTKIANGTFDYAAYFPNSKTAKSLKKQDEAPATFKDKCESWLKTKGRLAPATLSQYRNALNFWQDQLGGDKSIDALTHAKVAEVVGSYPWASAKLCNNYLIPLRGVFALAGREIKGMDNPLEGIENGKHQATPPDPLSVEEMHKILADLRKRYDAQVANYFEFAFLTGMRPEELIALRWDDVDWTHGTIRVERAKTFKGGIKPIKTYAVRDVDLVGRAMEVLREQKAHTFMKAGRQEDWENGEIFGNPNTERPWHDERSQRDHFWQPCLKRVGIRMRRPYQTRHTYATTALMGGVNPAYISRQMGHKSAKMLFSVYAKWIDAADRGRERAKLEDMLNMSQVGPILDSSSPLSEGESGRHDWTRTNSRRAAGRGKP